MNDTKSPDVKIDQSLWLEQIEEEHREHPRIGEIIPYCLMAFKEGQVGTERANEIVERALQIFPA